MDLEPFIRLFIAALLTVPIGLDRELRGKAAGLRTHVVVATASAALGYVSLLSATGSGADGTRIAAQVVTGIGFLGAGVIFASGNRVHGLTSAAAVFSAAAGGLCVGLGETTLAVALSLVTFLFLWPLDRVTHRLIDGFASEERTLRIIAHDLTALARIQDALAREGVVGREVGLQPFGDAVAARVTVSLRRDEARALVARLRRLDDVAFVTDEAFTPSD